MNDEYRDSDPGDESAASVDSQSRTVVDTPPPVEAPPSPITDHEVTLVLEEGGRIVLSFVTSADSTWRRTRLAVRESANLTDRDRIALASELMSGVWGSKGS